MTAIPIIGNRIVVTILCFICAILALLATSEKVKNTSTGLFMLLPQQYILMESFLGGVLAICNSSFADGVVRPRAFIAADQGPVIFAGIFHTLAIIDYHLGQVLHFWQLKRQKK